MSWGALGVSAYADQMGKYCENIQTWLDISKKDLTAKGYENRYNQILGVTDIFETEITYPVNDIDRQLAVLALAIATGTRFEFIDGKYANDWILFMSGKHECMFDSDLSEYLTKAELLQLKLI